MLQYAYVNVSIRYQAVGLWLSGRCHILLYDNHLIVKNDTIPVKRLVLNTRKRKETKGAEARYGLNFRAELLLLLPAMIT